ncbi:MAG: sigma-70 family RNA polymerase sigma factor [Candidatus Binatia bacterium]
MGAPAQWIEQLGVWAYILAPLFMIVVAILPIPAEIPAMVNGMVFGTTVGTVIRYQQTKREAERVDWERIDQVYESMVEQGEKVERDDPEGILISRLMGEEVEEALRELPEDYRTAIMLVDIEELSYEEAAEVVECAVGTVRSRVSRARRMLQVA